MYIVCINVNDPSTPTSRFLRQVHMHLESCHQLNIHIHPAAHIAKYAAETNKTKTNVKTQSERRTQLCPFTQ